MTRYFFDLQNGEGFLKDTDGHDLPDHGAVRQEIAAILRDVVRDELNGDRAFEAKVTVRDDHGRFVSSASLAFQVE